MGEQETKFCLIYMKKENGNFEGERNQGDLYELLGVSGMSDLNVQEMCKDLFESLKSLRDTMNPTVTYIKWCYYVKNFS